MTKWKDSQHNGCGKSKLLTSTGFEKLWEDKAPNPKMG